MKTTDTDRGTTADRESGTLYLVISGFCLSICIVFPVLLLALNYWILPKFELVFDQLGSKLPVTTEMVLGFSSLLSDYPILYGIFILPYGLWIYLRTNDKNMMWYTFAMWIIASLSIGIYVVALFLPLIEVVTG